MSTSDTLNHSYSSREKSYGDTHMALIKSSKIIEKWLNFIFEQEGEV